MIVVTILGIIASIGVPQYLSALRTARIAKSRHELQTISHAIDAYAATHGGHWPLTLYQVGFGNRRDPWGMPYCYLNYADGTGDGLSWAVSAGLVDPAAFLGLGPQRPRLGDGVVLAAERASGGGTQGPAVPAIAASQLDTGSPAIRAVPAFAAGPQGRPQGRAQVAQAAPTADQGPAVPVGNDDVVNARPRVSEATVLASLARELLPEEMESLKTSLASGTGFSVFVGVATDTTRRRDRYMYPLNTDYDLFSLGPDGRTAVSLGQAVGLDDVIRANNGGFFGSAADY